MITFIANLRVPPENAAAFETLMTHVAAMSNANEPGVVELIEGVPQLVQYASPGQEPVAAQFEDFT